jgi:hypothetical protein
MPQLGEAVCRLGDTTEIQKARIRQKSAFEEKRGGEACDRNEIFEKS